MFFVQTPAGAQSGFSLGEAEPRAPLIDGSVLRKEALASRVAGPRRRAAFARIFSALREISIKRQMRPLPHPREMTVCPCRSPQGPRGQEGRTGWCQVAGKARRQLLAPFQVGAGSPPDPISRC